MTSTAIAHDRDSLEIDPLCISDQEGVGIDLTEEDASWLIDFLTLGETNHAIRNGLTSEMWSCYRDRETHSDSYRASGTVSVDVERWRTLVETYFPEDWVEWGLRIMQCESKGDPNAKNPESTAAGLFQFLKGTWNWVAVEQLGFSTYESGAVYDPELNVRAAAWLLANGGTSHWTCKASK